MTKDNSIPAAQIDWAASFINRGLSVLILHDVSSGRCSCLPRYDGTECKTKNQGKHPRMGGAWQHAGMTRMEDVTPWLTAHPYANIGILTGPPSGVWVLDVDPDDGGDVALAELERAHGALPVTYTVRTGSGGRHHYFTLPADFTPTNANRLPMGLDTRGAGGQVVAPGSRTLRGEYTVEVDVPPVAAPDWLLDHVRPRPVVESAAGSVGAGAAADWAPQARDPRLTAYALAAVRGELDKLAGAAPGGRGATAHGAAMALIELCNSPWSGLDATAVRLAYLDAAAQAAASYIGAGHDFDVAEAERIWDRDVMRVAGRGRAVPAELDFGGVVPGVDWSATGAGVPPFGATAPATESSGLGNPFAIPAPRSGSEQGADVSRNLADTRGQSADEAFEREVRTQMLRMSAAEEARRRLRDSAAERQVIKDRLRKHLLKADELDALDGLEPLISGWLVKDSVVRVNGESGAGKSFVLLDMVAAVASGQQWHGCDVASGSVVYLVAEGAAGIGKRVRAWERHHGIELDNVHFLTIPVQAGTAEWDAFVELVAELAPAMVVLDTQARITVGMEENSATEMGLLVHAVEALRAATKACVALVHHKGVAGERGRGSTAVKAAVQTELFVTRNRNVITLTQGKQKDDAEAVEMEFVMTPVALGTDRRGTPVGSIVLRRTTAIVGSGRPEPIELLLAVMHESFAIGNGGTKAEIQHVVVADRGLMKRTAFYVAWNELLKRKCIGKVPGTQGGWRYVEIEDREHMVEPLNDTKNPDAFYVPRGN